MGAKKTIYKKKRNRRLWTEQAQHIFLDMWEEKLVELRGKRKNSHIYKEMAAELAKKAVEISPEQVGAKIKNLRAKFRKFKSCIGTSGGYASDWPLYDRVKRIIGSQHIHNRTGIVVDGIIDIQDSQSGDIDLTAVPSDGETSPSLKSQSLTTSLKDMPPTISSADKPSFSSGAENKKLIEMFEKFGNSFELAVAEYKKCTEEQLALEREKIKIFQNISDSTDKLATGILDFLKNSNK